MKHPLVKSMVGVFSSRLGRDGGLMAHQENIQAAFRSPWIYDNSSYFA